MTELGWFKKKELHTNVGSYKDFEAYSVDETTSTSDRVPTVSVKRQMIYLVRGICVHAHVNGYVRT